MDPPSIWPSFLRWHLKRLFFPRNETLAMSERETEIDRLKGKEVAPKEKHETNFSHELIL